MSTKRRGPGRAAKRDGISLNPFINTALAGKVAALQAGEVFTERAARADRARFLDLLERLGVNRRERAMSCRRTFERLEYHPAAGRGGTNGL